MTTQFLRGEDPAIIADLQPLFDESVRVAKAIAEAAGVDFYEIREVRYFSPQEEQKIDPNCAAYSMQDDATKTASIVIRRSADPEALTHEVGHSLFHPSPLHDRHGEDPSYGDMFCNAFRYAMSPDKGTAWMQRDGSRYDAHKLIEKCPDMESFTRFFVDLCERKRQDMTQCVLSPTVI